MVQLAVVLHANHPGQNIAVQKKTQNFVNVNVTVITRGCTNHVLGKPCFCPLPKRGRFDENSENDEFAFYPLKTRVSLFRTSKTTIMTKMAGVTQAKAWF